jgi:Uma2 family endonuclease
MSGAPLPYLTPEQYLEIDRAAAVKSEYYNGAMFTIAGGSVAHSRLQLALARAVGNRLDLRKRMDVSSDMRIRVSATGLYTYPDYAVVCGPPALADKHKDTLLNPVFIAEVLSPSSVSYDRGQKFRHYRAIETLRHYMLVSQDRMLVEVFTLAADGLDYATASKEGELVRLPAIGVEFPVEELYVGVELPSES